MLKVWDFAVRASHWGLVALVTLSVTTGLVAGNAMVWHERSGVLILVIVLFRWVWGFVGSTTARFADFLHGPTRLWAFTRAILTRQPFHVAGHNPLGGWMVLALLLSLSLQVATGLFADDEILTTGPLNYYVSAGTGSTLTAIHGTNAWVLVTLVALHIGAVLFHRVVRGDYLVLPMVTGHRPWPADAAVPELHFRPAWLAPLLFSLILVAVYATLSLVRH